MKLVCLVLMVLACSETQAQFYLETGVPTLFRVKSSANTFVKSFGFYTNLGYDFKKFGLETKLYAAPQVAFSRKFRGYGLGGYYRLTYEKCPKISINTGLSLLWIRRTDYTVIRYDRTLITGLAELKVHYQLNKNILSSLGLGMGYAKERYDHISQFTKEPQAINPYLLSIGIKLTK